jgi:hypothetical protein
VTLSTGSQNVDAKAGYYSYDTYSGSLSVYREFGHGISLNRGREVRYSASDEINVAAIKHREDVWIESNIAPWDYDVHSVDLKLTKTF